MLDSVQVESKLKQEQYLSYFDLVQLRSDEDESCDTHLIYLHAMRDDKSVGSYFLKSLVVRGS